MDKDSALKYGILRVASILESIFAGYAVFFNKNIDVIILNDFIEAMKSCVGLVPFIVVLLIFYLHKYALLEQGNNSKKAEAFISICFSQCYWVGFRFDHFEDHPINLSVFGILQYIIITIGLSFLFCNFITVIMSRMSKADIRTIDEKPVMKPAMEFAAVSLVCFLAYLPYYWIFYPGIVTADSYSQINQALGNIPLSNHHPFGHTLLEGVFINFCNDHFNSIVCCFFHPEWAP